MSFTLQVFHAPGVRTIDQAEAFFRSTPPASQANRARFNAFRDDILRVYPDNSRASSDEVDNAWPEGWPQDLGGDAVLGFAVATDFVDDNLMRHLGHAAARAGLHLLDMQAGRLYRSDATTIDVHGREQPLGAAVPPQPKQRLSKALTVEALGSHLTAAFIARHPQLGFVASQRRGFAEMDRTAGEVRQRLSFQVSLRTEEASIGVSMAFFCPRLSAVWERLMGDEVAASMAVQHQNPHRRPELSLHTDDFVDPPGDLALELGRRNYARVRSWAEADAFIDRFDTWFVRQGAPAFERLTTPAGLARLALTDYQMHWLYYEANVSIEEMFSRLVLVGTFDAQRKDAWMKALRDHRKRQGPRIRGASIVPDSDAALESLAGMIGSAAFAAATVDLSAGPIGSAPPEAEPETASRVVLQVWEQPVGRGWPRDWAAAMAWLATMREARSAPDPRFAELARLLAGHGAGVALQDAHGAVGAIGLPEPLRGPAFETARALGLSVADEEGGSFHYANGFVVTRNRGYCHRLPDRVFEDPDAPGYRLAPADDLLPLAGMLDLACLRLDRFFRRHGFVRRADQPQPEAAADAPAPRYVSRLYRRPQRAGWAELQVDFLAPTSAVAMQVDCAACLSDAARLNKQFFIANGGEDDGQEHSTVFTRQHHWMTDPQGLLGTDSGLYFIARMDDLDKALAHFMAQAEARLLPLLTAFDSAAGVDALLNAGETPTSIFFEGSYEFAEQHLVVARVARSPRFEALCDLHIERALAYRAGRRRSVFGDTVQKLRDLATFLKAH